MNLNIIKNKLPKKWAATLAENTGLSGTTVRNFFSGVNISNVNAERIFDAALLVIKESYDEKDWSWRFERAVFLVHKEINGKPWAKLQKRTTKKSNEQNRLQNAETN